MNLKINREANSINTLRFFAAFQVMWGHMIEHLDVINNVSTVEERFFQGITSVLKYFNGVPLFFFISGYLIYFSIQSSKSTKEYFAKRFRRIYPELWGGILIEIISILIFYKERIKWFELGVFAVAQGTIFQFWTPDFLRGYGCGTPNGALWTICVTVQFYIVAWLTRKFWSSRKPRFWITSIVVFMIIGACTGIVQELLPAIIFKLYCQTLVQYLWIFWLGLAVAEYADKLLSILKRYWWISIAVFAAWKVIGIDVYARNYPIFMTTISCLGCLGIAYAFPTLKIKIDVSYAMFIYHMILVNVLISIGCMGVKGLIITTVVTILAAFLSTVSVGKWAMKKGVEEIR